MGFWQVLVLYNTVKCKLPETVQEKSNGKQASKQELADEPGKQASKLWRQRKIVGRYMMGDYILGRPTKNEEGITVIEWIEWECEPGRN